MVAENMLELMGAGDNIKMQVSENVVLGQVVGAQLRLKGCFCAAESVLGETAQV